MTSVTNNDYVNNNVIHNDVSIINDANVSIIEDAKVSSLNSVDDYKIQVMHEGKSSDVKKMYLNNISKMTSVLNKHDGLRIAHLNIRSLLPKIEEIRLLLESTQLDVFCITETWLDHTVGTGEIKVDRYNAIRNDRNRCINLHKGRS